MASKHYIAMPDVIGGIGRMICALDEMIGDEKSLVIVGIPRSGLIPANYISHHFKAKLLIADTDSVGDYLIIGDGRCDNPAIAVVVDAFMERGRTMERVAHDTKIQVGPDKIIRAVLCADSCRLIDRYADVIGYPLPDDGEAIFPWMRR